MTRHLSLVRRGLIPILAAGLIAVAVPKSAEALTIVPTFGTGMSAGAQAAVNTAIAFYNSTFSDPITVNIEFHNMASGLGASLKPVYSPTWVSFKAALLADATSTDDATANTSLAVANIGGVSNDPVHNKSTISVGPANGRAIGLATPGVALNPGNTGGFCTQAAFVGDGCIGLNLGITDLTVAGGFHLISVIEHEIDEVLGMGSGLGGGAIFLDQIFPKDLFRWASAGVRSFATNPSGAVPCAAGTPTANFSINGGTTTLNSYNNCDNGGDYDDWITHTPTQVQDAFTNNTGNPELTAGSTEAIGLDVIGYTRTVQGPGGGAVPEPISLVLLGTGLVGAAAARRRNRKS